MRRSFLLLPFLIAAGSGLHAAPVPYSLEHAIHSPSTARQTGNALGYSVAADGDLLALGMPYDDIGGVDSGIVRVHHAGTGALLHEFGNPAPAKESYFGLAVALSGNRLVVGAPEDDTGENDTGIAYVYDLSAPSPAASVLVLANPSPGENDTFGWSVAIDGDLVVAGVPEGDSGVMDAGCAYVYDLASPTPAVPVLELHNPNAGGENFGVSVAVSGRRIVIGAAPDGAGGDSCRAYVYDLDSAEPEIPALVLADPSPASNDHFGLAVDISGSFVAVGAPQTDGGAQNEGACYVYDLSGTSPELPFAVIPNPAPALNDTFGSAVAVEGLRLAVGTSLDDNGSTDSGRIHLFDLSSGSPGVPVLAIENPTPATNDFFARSVALSGDRLAAGAHGDNTTAADAGIAYLFDLASGTPGAPALTFHPSSPSSDEEFGTAVALQGTVIASGSPHDDKGATNAGSVSVYDITSGTPQAPVLVIDNPAPGQNDYFGAAVALSGNLVIASAYQDDASSASNSGTVYVFNRTSPTPAQPVLTISNPSPQAGDSFGNALAVSGSLLAVGAIENDTGAADAGSVYVYDLSSQTPSVPVLVLDHPEPAADDWFGQSVAISGTTIAIGAHGNDSGATDAGSVYVYDTASPSPTVPVAILRNPEPGAGDWFGYSVGISGSRVVVGSHLNDTGDEDAGSAYVFDLGSPDPEVPAAVLDHPLPEREDYFGIAVAISGTRVVVGASEVDAGSEDSGSAFVYELTSAAPAVPVEVLDYPAKEEGDFFGLSAAIDGANILVGAPRQDGNTENRGAIFYFDPDPPSPQMQVEQPPGTGLPSGQASIHFGDAATGSGGSAETVAIRNVGTAALELSAILLSAGSTADFSLDAPELPVVLQVDQSISFEVGFLPVSPGSRVATLRILSNANSAGTFEITLTGQALSAGSDTDGDGLNDVVELELEGLGFDWQVNDEELVAILRAGANATGLYSGDQLQELHPGMPLLPRDPSTGDFILTVAVKRSGTLADFELFPVTEPQVSITPQGAAELSFGPQGNKCFFLLEPR